jgi:CheY-like chemotaxis protein
MNMPGTSGLDLMRELLRVRPELPVVLTSGLVTDELRASAEALGCGEILNKPATLVEIAEALQRALSVG